MPADRFFLSALVVVASAVSLTASAEPATPSSSDAASAAPDYSALLEKLADLGLPKLDGARGGTGRALNQRSSRGGDLWSPISSADSLWQVLGPLGQAWYPPVTLASDLDGVLARLGKKAEEWRTERARSSDSSSWRVAQEAEVAGGLMVFATELWRAGERDAANRVADAVFAAISPRDRVLNAALSRFADAELLASSRGADAHGRLAGLRREFTRLA